MINADFGRAVNTVENCYRDIDRNIHSIKNTILGRLGGSVD